MPVSARASSLFFFKCLSLTPFLESPLRDRQGSTGPEYAIHGSSEITPTHQQIADSAELPISLFFLFFFPAARTQLPSGPLLLGHIPTTAGFLSPESIRRRRSNDLESCGHGKESSWFCLVLGMRREKSDWEERGLSLMCGYCSPTCDRHMGLTSGYEMVLCLFLFLFLMLSLGLGPTSNLFGHSHAEWN